MNKNELLMKLEFLKSVTIGQIHGADTWEDDFFHRGEFSAIHQIIELVEKDLNEEVH